MCLPSPKRQMAVLAAVALASLPACGGDDDGESGSTVTVPSGEVLRVTAKEYRFDPGSVVVEGGPLRVSLENRGKLAHNLHLMDGDRNLGGTNTFQAGRTQTAEVELGPGRYKMVCTVGSHEELGMEGTVEVK